MIDTTNNMLTLAQKREEQISRVMEKLYSAAQPGAVYSEPVTAGNYTIISACEISAGGGFGSGLGLTSPKPQDEASQPQTQSVNSSGGGFGGGGGSNGRPVAVIVIGPDGVTVRPVVDVTKIALAGVTVWGSMLMLLGRMRRANKR
ncbi:MAG TPA: hypothetical protein VKR06_24450 [Ktedonosporobacter sp.]|nr:hypothetical protein [Ktedonosporobacter sp.]